MINGTASFVVGRRRHASNFNAGPWTTAGAVVIGKEDLDSVRRSFRFVTLVVCGV